MEAFPSYEQFIHCKELVFEGKSLYEIFTKEEGEPPIPSEGRILYDVTFEYLGYPKLSPCDLHLPEPTWITKELKAGTRIRLGDSDMSFPSLVIQHAHWGVDRVKNITIHGMNPEILQGMMHGQESLDGEMMEYTELDMRSFLAEPLFFSANDSAQHDIPTVAPFFLRPMAGKAEKKHQLQVKVPIIFYSRADEKRVFMPNATVFVSADMNTAYFEQGSTTAYVEINKPTRIYVKMDAKFIYNRTPLVQQGSTVGVIRARSVHSLESLDLQLGAKMTQFLFGMKKNKQAFLFSLPIGTQYEKGVLSYRRTNESVQKLKDNDIAWVARAVPKHIKFD